MFASIIGTALTVDRAVDSQCRGEPSETSRRFRQFRVFRVSATYLFFVGHFLTTANYLLRRVNTKKPTVCISELLRLGRR